MTNNELRTILEARREELVSQRTTLLQAANDLKPKSIDVEALRILNLAGQTVPIVDMPTPPQVELLETQAQIFEEIVGRIETVLESVPENSEGAVYTLSNAMDWGINTNPDVLRYLSA